jgi:hypothetical protein
VPGAVLVTAAVMLAVFGITGADRESWARTGGALAGAAVLLVAFAATESRAATPLLPLRLLRQRNLTVASLIGVLWSAAMFACFFLTTLYLQLVLGYRPLPTGLAFLPMNVIMSCLSAGAAARLVARFGIKPPLVTGLLLPTPLSWSAQPRPPSPPWPPPAGCGQPHRPPSPPPRLPQRRR